jgi:hypothetical protein
LAAFCLTKLLSSKVAIIIRDVVYFRVFISKSCSRKILCRFQLKEVGSQDSILTAQSCVRTPICVKKPNSSWLHPSGRHGNTSEHISGFKKIRAFLHRHGMERQLAPVRTLGQHCSNAKILYKEIAYILSAFVWTTGKHRSDAVLLWQLFVDKM